MFEWFKIGSGVTPEFEEWSIKWFNWLKKEFGRRHILQYPVILPHEHFPVQFNGSEDSAQKTLEIVAHDFKLKTKKLELRFYSQQTGEFYDGRGKEILLEDDPFGFSSGQYHGRNDNGKFEIWLETSLLEKPEDLIATIAHELSHVKLLGENRLIENDEYLTDLLTVIFGYGIFNANVAFRFETSSDRWGYQKQGYLVDQEWGFVLAHYAFLRGETPPLWLKYLRKSVQSDFKRSMKYIQKNAERFSYPPLEK